jgi:hypothetical protein
MDRMRRSYYDNFQSSRFRSDGYIERLEDAYTNSIEYRSSYKRKIWASLGVILVLLIAFGIGLVVNFNHKHNKKSTVETALLPT